MQRVLSPVIDRPAYADLVARELLSWVNDALYGPVLTLLRDEQIAVREADMAIKFDERGEEKLDRQERINAGSSALEDALRSGRVWYADGAFGSDAGFNAELSRELRALGAHYDSQRKVFTLSPDALPFSLRGMISQAQARSEGIHRAIAGTLTEIQANVLKAPAGLRMETPLARILVDLNGQFNKSVKALEAITVAPELQAPVREALTKTLTENLELGIKNFAEEQIPELRKMVEANLRSGARLDKLSGMIQAQYGVARRKAKFLASQETSLLTAKFRMERAKNVGSTRYVWMTRHDSRVRPGHQILNGRQFFWDDPPLVDQASNRHANPGEDFNCFPADARINLLGGVKKAFRRWYSGMLTTIILPSGETLRATPNHPVLTLDGWKAIGSLNDRDQIIQITQELLRTTPEDSDQRVTTIGELFESLWESGAGETLPGKADQFHGDGSNRQIDVIRSARGLMIHDEFTSAESCGQLNLSAPDPSAPRQRLFFSQGIPSLFRECLDSAVRRLRKLLTLFECSLRHAEIAGLGLVPYSCPGFDQVAAYNSASNTQPSRDRKFTLPCPVGFNDRLWVKLNKVVSVASVRVRHKESGKFEGYVYNLETNDGCYATANVIVSNCRCIAAPIIELIKKEAAA